jgi:regulator of RNase E activity RraA
MHMNEQIRLLSGGRLSGPAVTMRVVPDDHASSTEEGLKAIKVLETAPAGSVIVVAVEGDKGYAIFGATFATLAKSRRLQGFVVDGSMRGVADFQRLGLPMYATGTVSGSAGGHFRLDAVDVPVLCGGVEIAPGDFVIGDADGVAVAPRQVYEEVLAGARRLRDEKEALLPLIAKRRSYTDAVKERRMAREATNPKRRQQH